MGHIKVNVDGGCDKDKVGSGIIIRNNTGQNIGVLTKPFMRSISPLVTELLALKEALSFCLELGFSTGVVRSDSKEAV